jgi:hypothetical protein
MLIKLNKVTALVTEAGKPVRNANSHKIAKTISN